MHNDRRCQKILYEKYYAYALKTVFRYVYQYDRAVDVVNDGFVKVFRHFEKFRHEQGELEMLLMGWIKRIMINTAIDQLRKENGSVELHVLPQNVWDEQSAGSADSKVLYKELIGYVRQLPPGYRMVFNLFVIDGYTHTEIGEMLGITTGTSKSNLSKARAYLQELLKKTSIVANAVQ